MTKRIIDSALCALLLLACASAACLASDLRHTPLVRAVERAKASVVNIHSEKTARNSDALFASGKGRKVNGMGTGIVIDERGYIVTNYHVINGVDSLRVTLHDGATYDAAVTSFDSKHDLAIVKIDATEPLAVMSTGTSSDIMLGETVIAVGNAYGYEHTVTAGIISARSRDVEVNEKQSYKNLIQTDASINPGNSGGPLLNLKGELVGINVAIRAGAQRIGFAIPIDDARAVIASLLSVEKLDHAYHGLKARDFKSPDEQKLIVTSAAPDSPAANAGFQTGDIIVKAGTTEIADAADFERALLGQSEGAQVEVVVRRDSKTETLNLTLGAEPLRQRTGDGDESIVSDSGDHPRTLRERTWDRLGMRIAPLKKNEPVLANSDYRGGMRVNAVRRGSPAAASRIRPGDILLGLHVWETTSEQDITYVLDHPELTSFSPLKFYVLRGRETMFGFLHPSVAER